MRRFLRSSIFLNTIVGIVLLLLLAVGAYSGVNIIVEQRQECAQKLVALEACEREIAQAKAEIKVLEKKERHLRQPQGVEDAAREKLGMVRKGEVVYVVDGVQPSDLESQQLQATADAYQPGRRPSGLFFSLFGPLIF